MRDIAVTRPRRISGVAREAGGVDVVIDIVGAPYSRGNVDALNRKGRLVLVSTLGGNDAKLPIFTVMSKQLVITGSTLRPRSADEKARLAEIVKRGSGHGLPQERFGRWSKKLFRSRRRATRIATWMKVTSAKSC